MTKKQIEKILTNNDADKSPREEQLYIISNALGITYYEANRLLKKIGK